MPYRFSKPPAVLLPDLLAFMRFHFPLKLISKCLSFTLLDELPFSWHLVQ